MRKLFSFRTSAPSSGNCDTVLPPSINGNVYWEPTFKSGVENRVSDKAKSHSQSPKDPVLIGGKRCPESQDSAGLGLRRSLSFSSPATGNDLGGRDFNCLSDFIRSPTNNILPLHATDYPIRCHYVTPERQREPKSRHQAVNKGKTRAAEKLDSPCSARSNPNSSGNSPHSSPVPLRCRAARLTNAPNKILDLYIDGEQQEGRPKNNSKRSSPDAVSNGCPVENKTLPGSRRPRQVQSTAPVSPSNKEHLRSFSFRESREHHSLSTKDWKRESVRPSSPQKLAKSVVERLCQAFPRKSKIKVQDFDSQTTTTVEDIYEDYSMAHARSDSSSSAQESSLYDHVSMCHSSDPPYENTMAYYINGISGFQKQSHVNVDSSMDIKHENLIFSGKRENDIDVELSRKGKEAEERVMQLSEELEQRKLENSSFSMSALLQTIRNISNDRRNLALEVTTQIHSRIAERTSASEAIKQAKIDLDAQTRRLEKDKTEFQLSMEKELDRRSCEWSLKLEKYQSEEKRLRERVQELAEQNVSLQREVASLSSREVETSSRMMHLEVQLNDVTARLEQVRAEKCNLQQSVSELEEHCRGEESDRDCIKRSYKEKEKENKELQKVIARLQRICNEQEKTVTGLRQGLGEEISKQYSEKGNVVVNLKMEQLRLTSVEQMLRKEVESFRLEVESLRHENINLLDRLCGTGNGECLSSFKLNQELCDRVDCLQTQCLLLLDEIGRLCGKLLGLAKGKACYDLDDPRFNQAREIGSEFDGYSVVECDMKFQSSMRRVENLRRSLQSMSSILQEKSNLIASESQSTDGSTLGDTVMGQLLEGNVEFELKAERLVTKILREKLCFKELELEQLQAELATSVRGHDILRCELQRAQDSISSLTHKLKDLELQMLKKDENITLIQGDLQECLNELMVMRGMLPKITQERDLMWEEVKQCSEKNMLLNCEVNSLKKKIESLDEDILMKEGQITILKDSIVNKPFDILFNSPTSMKEFTLQ
ncbi:hypothetical protein AAC387_Pa02g4783 [Persea americana]